MFEAFKIGVRISLINHASTGLVALSRGFLKAEGDAAKLQKRMESIKGMFIGGAMTFGAGAAGLYGMEKLIKPAMEYQHQLAQLNIAGMNHLEIVQATKAAWDAMKVVPTSTATENLAVIRHSLQVFGNSRDAIANMPVMQQLQAILRNTNDAHGGKFGSAGSDAYTLAKALEMRGATRTPGEFKTEANLMTKAIVASGGRVTPQDFLSAVTYGRRAAYGWSNDFMYRILPTLIQEMKGSGSGGARGPGNAIMSAYNAIVGGVIPQKSLGVYNHLGLIDPSKVVWTKTHSMKGVKPGGIVGADLFQESPYLWAQNILLPAMEKNRIADPKKMREVLQYMFPNRTASIMDQMVMQAWKFQRDMKITDKANGLGAYQNLLKNDPEMAALALQKQWQNLMIRLGYTIMPKLLDGIQWLIPRVEGLTKWTMQHGEVVKKVLLGFAGFSAALMVGGTLMMTVSALRYLGIALKFAAIGGPVGIIRMAGAIRVWGGAIAMSNVGGASGILGIGKSLTSMAGALGLVTQAVAVFMAAYAGWQAGGWLNRNVLNPMSEHATGVKGETFGTLLYGYLNPVDAKTGKNTSSFWRKVQMTSGPFGMAMGLASMFASDDPDGVKAYRSNRASAKTVQVHTTINMDGKKVATAVSKHQASAMTAPQTGVTGTDLSGAPPPIGLNLSPVH